MRGFPVERGLFSGVVRVYVSDRQIFAGNIRKQDAYLSPDTGTHLFEKRSFFRGILS